MNASRHDLVAEIFREAVAQCDSSRTAYLECACEGDQALLREVEGLLDHADAASGVFRTPAGQGRLHHIGQKLAMPGHIGDYQLIDVIGDGGMAVVYLARQEAPRREVALKMIKQGMDTHQVVSRFASEREALAVMDHPNIAQVFDAGVTGDGKPYFIMEYVRGQPVNRFCDENRLSLRERLELMLAICDAVEHAHQKGVIHRDLKPSNILVSQRNDQPVPKIIDFGIAKSIELTIAGEADLTRHGQIVGTPAYMSPEQADASSCDVDTRSDVYSLGVVLHELLVGALPGAVDSPSVRSGDVGHVIDALERPSHRLRRAAPQERDRWAQERDTRAEQHIQALRGDLDWILLRTLALDREQRYPTASALARDLRRHLTGTPVEAHPPSVRYQIARFVDRNRLAVMAAASVLVMLVVTLVALFVGLNRSIDSRRAAEAAEAQAVTQAALAERESSRAQAVTDFLVDLFEISSPAESRGNNITAREILDQGVARMGRHLEGQPAARAALLDTMARVYMNLGLYEVAEPLAKEAVDAQAAYSESDPGSYAQTLRTRGLVYYYRGDYRSAEAIHTKALEINRAAYGSESLFVAENRHNLAMAIFEQGRYAEAMELFEQVLESRRNLLSPPNERTAESLNSLASAKRRLGDIAGARILYRESLDTRLALGQEVHPETAITLSNLGVTLFNLREYAEAERILRRALEMQEIVFDEKHPQIGTVLSNLGAALVTQEKNVEAETVLRQSVAFHRSLYGPAHPNTANVLNNLGTLLLREGQLAESEALFRESIAILEQPQTLTLPMLGIARANLASNLVDQRRAAPARALADEALTQLQATLPANHPWISVAQSILGAALGQLGETEQADALLRQSLPVLEKTFGANGYRTVEARRRLASLDQKSMGPTPAEL